MNQLLGKTCKDKITGFVGVVTGFCEYLSGCNQALLVPRVTDSGSLPESQWFDEQRLDVQDAPAISLDNSKTPGFDKPAPRR